MLAALHSRAAVPKQLRVPGGAVNGAMPSLLGCVLIVPQLGSGSAVTWPPQGWGRPLAGCLRAASRAPSG